MNPTTQETKETVYVPLPVGSIVYLPTGEELHVHADNEVSFYLGTRMGGFQLPPDIAICSTGQRELSRVDALNAEPPDALDAQLVELRKTVALLNTVIETEHVYPHWPVGAVAIDRLAWALYNMEFPISLSHWSSRNSGYKNAVINRAGTILFYLYTAERNEETRVQGE
jgi:hypothetical protein